MNFITSNGGEIVAKENWGLKNFATIRAKVVYHLFDFKTDGKSITPFETEFRRDEQYNEIFNRKVR